MVGPTFLRTHHFDDESIDDIEISIVVNPAVDGPTLVPPPVIVSRDELIDIANGA